MAEDKRCSREELEAQLPLLPTVGDLVRLVTLDQASLISGAKETQLQRETARLTARKGAQAPEVAALNQRSQLQALLITQIQAETERTETQTPEAKKGAGIVFGRVMNGDRIGLPELTVAALDASNTVIRFVCTDAKGAFQLEIPVAGATGGPPTRKIFLQVSDKAKAVLFRDKDGIEVAGQARIYREIIIGEEREIPCPPPPEPEPEPTTARVPDVVGRSEREAGQLIRAARLVVGEPKTAPSQDQVGRVVAQEPAAGTEVPFGSAVILTIGVQQGVTVPSVVGQPQSDAEKTLKKSGLDVGEISLRSDDRVGIVLEQSPKAGQLVDPGTAVDLVVGRKDSDDGETISVPDLRSLKLEQAQEILANAKLKQGSVTRRAGTDDGTVLDQSPAPGTLVAPEASVNLVVSIRARLSRNQIVARFEKDREFEGLGLTAEELKQRLAELGINSLAKIKELAAQSNASIRRSLKLKNNNQVQVFGRLVKRLLPTPS